MALHLLHRGADQVIRQSARLGKSLNTCQPSAGSGPASMPRKCEQAASHLLDTGQRLLVAQPWKVEQAMSKRKLQGPRAG